jgi:hypothetical protein
MTRFVPALLLRVACFLPLFHVVALAAVPNFNQEPVCTKYRCSRGSVPVPKRGLNLKAGGCSALTSGSMGSMGGSFGGMAGRQSGLETCCNVFQACQSICGARRKSCSDGFTKCMEKTCAKIADTEAQEACSRDASLHGMLINLGGCKTYDSAQAASCRCVVEKKVLGKRRQVLSTFWAKYNRKKTAEDVDRVLAKYSNSPSSFARLLLKLVQKYKKSIKVSKSKYEDAMDELLRQARDSRGRRSSGSSSSSSSSSSSESLNPSRPDEHPSVIEEFQDAGEEGGEDGEGEVIDLDQDTSDEM